jgi:hypothetical protein
MLTSINIMFECQYLLIHLSYYIIAHYIKLLSLHFDVEDGELPATLSRRYINLFKFNYSIAIFFKLRDELI